MPYFAALSTRPDTRKALDEVSSGAIEALGGPADLALLFFSPHHAAGVAGHTEYLRKRLGTGCLLGCSGESVIGNDWEIERQPALSLWLARWNRPVKVEPFHVTVGPMPEEERLVGLPAGTAGATRGSSLMLLLGEPFTFRADRFLDRINRDFPGLPVMGGLASGGREPGSCKLLLGDRLREHGAVGVLLRGAVDCCCLVAPGCRAVGKPVVVTKARENVLIELDGTAAATILQQIAQNLGPRDLQLLQRGLLIGRFIDAPSDQGPADGFLARATLGIDNRTGGLVIEDRCRIGEKLQFLVRDAESADRNLQRLLQETLHTGLQNPGGALLFTCTWRGSRLFPQPHHDAAVLRQPHDG